MHQDKPVCISYLGGIQNKIVVYEENLKLKSSLRTVLQSFFLMLLFLFRMIASKLFSKKIVRNKDLAVSWSKTHNKRLAELPQNFKSIYYDYKKIGKEDIALFSVVSIRRFLVHLKDLLFLKRNTKTYYDNFFYKIAFAVEFSFIEGLLLQKPKSITIAGTFDRLAIMFSELSAKMDIPFHVRQHGILGSHSGVHRLKISSCYYLYPFSKPYLSRYFLGRKTELFESKLIPPVVNEFNQKAEFTNCIAYATAMARTHINFQIIDAILEGLSKEMTLLIHPHPLEEDSIYQAYQNLPNVRITREKYSGIKYLFCRFSTLGLEALAKNITPVFIILDDLKITFDFLDAPDLLSFSDIKEFRSWLSQKSEIASYYEH